MCESHEDKMMMYAREVAATAKSIPTYKERNLKGSLGLTSEAGEVAGLMEKVYYQDHPIDQEFKEKLKKELGDVMWYAMYLMLNNGWTLEEVIQENIDKLRCRYKGGAFDAEKSIARVDGG